MIASSLEPRAPSRPLRLHYNENTAGCSPAVIAALRAITAEEIASYPDVAPFSARCARYLGVDATRVQLTNGLDEGIQVVAAWARRQAVSGRQPHMLLADPAFEMYGEFARMVDADLHGLPPEPAFRFPIDALLASIRPDTRAIFLTDPNNPTGIGVPVGMAETIAAAAPDALVFVDEAYADFSRRTLIGEALDRHSNLVIGRTFAKGHGLAGLRIGALVAHPETIRSLTALLPPFNVNIAALRALDAALADRAYLDWYVAEAAASREIVYAFCRRHALEYWPSEANFVLIRFGTLTSSLVEALAAQGIELRDKSAAPGCAGCIRLTTGVVAHTEAALAAMEGILAARAH